MKIENLGEIFDGPHATPTRIDQGPYFLNIASLNRGRLSLDLSDHVSEDDFARWTKRVTPQRDDLLFSYETRLGEAALMPDGIRACLGRRMALIRPNREVIDPRFFLYLYLGQAFQETIVLNTIHGATVNRIPLNRMSDWEVQIPPLPEQQAIAEVLGALDDKIAANTRLAATAETFATTLVATCSKAVPLSGLAELSKAQSNPALFGAKLIDHYSLPAFDASALPVIEPADQIKSNKFVINQDVVLLSKLNPRFPRVWRAGVNPDRVALASTEFLVLNPVGVSREILWAALSQPTFATALDAKVAGTSGSHQRVRPVDALATLVADPRGLDAARTAALEAALGLASKSRAENRTLAAIRDALLPKLMSGQLRVTDVDRFVDTATATPLETTDKDRS